MIETLKKLIDAQARLAVPASELDGSANLYEAGLTPFTAIRVLLAVEKTFNVEFPRHMLNARNLRSIDAIADCLRQLEPRRAVA